MICDSKIHTGFIDVYNLSKYLAIAIEANITNRLIQINSRDICTRHEFAKMYLEEFGGNTALLSKGDWHFPRTENKFGNQDLGDELYFNLDVFNFENEFNIKVPSVKESIKHYKQKMEGKTQIPKTSSTGITFI